MNQWINESTGGRGGVEWSGVEWSGVEWSGVALGIAEVGSLFPQVRGSVWESCCQKSVHGCSKSSISFQHVKKLAVPGHFSRWGRQNVHRTVASNRFALQNHQKKRAAGQPTAPTREWRRHVADWLIIGTICCCWHDDDTKKRLSTGHSSVNFGSASSTTIGGVSCCEALIAGPTRWWIERWLRLWVSLSLSLSLSRYNSLFLSLSLSLSLSLCLSIYLSIYL